MLNPFHADRNVHMQIEAVGLANDSSFLLTSTCSWRKRFVTEPRGFRIQAEDGTIGRKKGATLHAVYPALEGSQCLPFKQCNQKLPCTFL